MSTDVKFSLPGHETVSISGQTIDKLIRAGDGDAALLYLYILKTRGQSTSGEAAAALGKSPGGIATAMAVLSRLGLVQLDGSSEQEDKPEDQEISPALPEKERTRHTVEDMKRELEAGSVFFALVEAAQGSLGKILAPDELMRLFSIYDSLHMAPEVILQLITHCIAECNGHTGGRMPSIRYIEKAAYTWEREGIFSLDKAEAYLKDLEARRSARGEIKKVLQIREREFSDTEKHFVDNWISMGFDAGAVSIAYDRTLVKTGKLAWSYMDSILKNWHSRGIRTQKEIIEKDKKPDKSVAFDSKKSRDQRFGAADTKDIERMQRLLNKIKED